MNFLQRISKTRQQAETANFATKPKVDTTRTLAKTMEEEKVIKVPEVVKNIGLEKYNVSK